MEKALAMSKQLAKQITEVQTKLKLNQNMRQDFLNKKLREFIYDHKAFKEAIFLMLTKRITDLQQTNMTEFFKDIEDRELANINDIQLGDEDRISRMPVSGKPMLKASCMSSEKTPT